MLTQEAIAPISCGNQNCFILQLRHSRTGLDSEGCFQLRHAELANSFCFSAFNTLGIANAPRAGRIGTYSNAI
jgi:hypothetical protein